MIRYIELYPADNIAFNSGKIKKTHISEGDKVSIDSLLFTVEAQGNNVDVLSTAEGKVQELLIFEGEIIHKQSSLLLLETIVDDPSPKVDTDSTNNGLTSDQSNAKTSTNTLETKTSVKTSEKTTMNEIKVPDLGGADAVEVIDILVNVGDTVKIEDALMTVESDKASMDIPASSEGKIEEIIIKVGDNVSEGDVIFKISGDSTKTEPEKDTPKEAPPAEVTPSNETKTENTASESSDVNVTIPDLGGANDVDVIDLLVSVGDSVEKDQAVITVESDKASMDVPTSHSGTITSITVSVGDKVNEGDTIIVVNSSDNSSSENSTTTNPPKPTETKPEQPAKQSTEASKAPEATPAPQENTVANTGSSHASPSVRRLARELGVNLSQVSGSARKNRITKADVKAFAKGIISSGSSANTQTHSTGSGIPEVPAQDFSKFGDIDIQPLNKIKRVTANHLHRSWLNIPHVTHNDESNIASLEEFRKTLNAENEKSKNGIKLSPLAFIVKAVVKALQTFPQFNSSLENGGENLIFKNYYNIGIAVETPNGLVVPVIKNADKMNVSEIAQAMGDIAKKARDGKLTANDMQGGTFTISSLGGIGGTHFTPIVNAPEVAILGVSRTKIQPVWNGTEFDPAPVLPLSLSYDHRVIDGAEAARFTRFIAAALEDLRRLTV